MAKLYYQQIIRGNREATLTGILQRYHAELIALMAAWYVGKIQDGSITIDDVAPDFLEATQALLDESEGEDGDAE